MAKVGVGSAVIPVLEFLNGRKWDYIAQGFIKALRPSEMEICRGGCRMDVCKWRVRVHLDDDDIIQCITQEVEVHLIDDIESGFDLKQRVGLK